MERLDQTIERILCSDPYGHRPAGPTHEASRRVRGRRRAVATGAADRHVRRKRARLRHRGDGRSWADGARPSQAIAGPSWQFDIRTFADVRCQAGAQTMGQPTTPPAGDLLCVLVRLQPDGADRFTCSAGRNSSACSSTATGTTWSATAVGDPSGPTPSTRRSRETHIEPFLDNWSLFDAFMEVSKTDPDTPGGPSAPPSRSRCRPRLGGLLNDEARAASHGPDGSIPDWAARPLTRQATSGSWERWATSLGHEHRRRRGRRTRAPVAASHGRAASPPDRKAGWRASSMTRACSPSASTGPSGSTHAARTVLARWSVPSSAHGFHVRSAGRAGGCRSHRRGRARRSRSCRAARWRGSTGRPRAPYMCTRPPLVAPHTSPSLRLRTFPFPVRPTRANVDGRRLPAAATTEEPSP